MALTAERRFLKIQRSGSLRQCTVDTVDCSLLSEIVHLAVVHMAGHTRNSGHVARQGRNPDKRESLLAR